MVWCVPSVAPQIARRINDRVAMDLLVERGAMTRADMRAATGMSQPSTLELFDRLMTEDLIEEAGAVSGRRGPQARLYRVNARRAAVAVVRVDQRETVAAVADLAGSLHQATVARAPRSGQGPAHELADCIRRALRGADRDLSAVHGVVVGTPGVIDPSTADVAYIDGLPAWRGAVRAEVEEALGIPVRLENQVKLLGLAELRATGPSAPGTDFVLVSLGPAGMAAALVLAGVLRRGAHGAAGEIAYLPLGSGAVRLESGNRARGGLLDVMAQGRWSSLTSWADLPVDAIVQAISAICAVVDPGQVVLAGPWGREGGPTLARTVQDALADHWPMPVTVVPTAVAGDAVLKGAAASGLERLRDELWGPTTTLTRNRTTS